MRLPLQERGGVAAEVGPFALCPICSERLLLDTMEVEERRYPAHLRNRAQSVRALYTQVKRWRHAECPKGHEFKADTQGDRICGLRSVRL